MILTYEQITEIPIGAVKVEECEDGIRFHRFTDGRRI